MQQHRRINRLDDGRTRYHIARHERFSAVDRGRGEPAELTEVHGTFTLTGCGRVSGAQRDRALFGLEQPADTPDKEGPGLDPGPPVRGAPAIASVVPLFEIREDLIHMRAAQITRWDRHPYLVDLTPEAQLDFAVHSDGVAAEPFGLQVGQRRLLHAPIHRSQPLRV